MDFGRLISGTRKTRARTRAPARGSPEDELGESRPVLMDVPPFMPLACAACKKSQFASRQDARPSRARTTTVEERVTTSGAPGISPARTKALLARFGWHSTV